MAYVLAIVNRTCMEPVSRSGLLSTSPWLSITTSGSVAHFHLRSSRLGAFARDPIGAGDDLEILDARDPTDPVRVGRYTPDSDPVDGYGAGTHLYLGTRHGELVVMDITRPSDPHQVGSIDNGYLPSGVHGDGNRAYVAMGNDGLISVDVSSPASPAESGRLATGHSVQTLAASSTHQFAGHETGGGLTGGFWVVDHTDPRRPKQLRDVEAAAKPKDLEYAEGLLYVGSSGGLEIFDVSDPTRPVLFDSRDTPDFAWDVVRTRSGIVHQADGNGGGFFTSAGSGWRRFQDRAEPGFVPWVRLRGRTKSPGGSSPLTNNGRHRSLEWPIEVVVIQDVPEIARQLYWPSAPSWPLAIVRL